jgi:hypothetical protein
VHLESIHLQGFRPYSDTNFRFTPGFNVVVANNGVGKTALIDAAAITLSALRGLDTPALQYRDLHATFGLVTTRARAVRLGAQLGGLRVVVEGAADRDRTVRRLHTEVHRPTSAELGAALGAGLDQGLGVPLMVRFGAYRATLDAGELIAPAWIGRDPPELGDGWALPTDLGSRWLPTRDAWSMVAYGATGGGRRDAATQAVIHQALQDALGAGPPEYDNDLLDFVVDLPGVGRRPVHLMSDGWRGTVALVVELAIRAAACWPGHEDAGRAATGTVLIDELEQHLHPQLQQQVADGLIRAFPNLQFIVATHSPYIARAATGAVLRLERAARTTEASDPGPTVREISGVELDRLRFGTTHEALEGAAFGVRQMRSPAGVQMLRDAAQVRRKVFRKEAISDDESALLRQVDAAFPSPEAT